MSESKWMPVTELGHVGNGHIVSLEARLAMDIVKHCALVAAHEDGEDSAGRQRLALTHAADVAARACDIAESMVAIWDRRGWIRRTEMTMEDESEAAGRLEGLRQNAQFNVKDRELSK